MEKRIALMSKNQKKKKAGEAKRLSTRFNSYSKFGSELPSIQGKEGNIIIVI